MGREELQLLRLSSHKQFSTDETNWARVRAQKERPQFSRTTPVTKKPRMLPTELNRVFQVKQPTRGPTEIKKLLVEEKSRRNNIDLQSSKFVFTLNFLFGV